MLATVPQAQALTLEDAIRIALESNPDIGQAIANREAIEFELDQAKGLYLPSVDLEARYGTQRRDSSTTRGIGTHDDWLEPREVDLVISQTIFDGFNRRGERVRQAARVDGASHRVFERSEFISLSILREYLEVGLRRRVVDLATENIAYHRRILSDLREAEDAISIADVQQAEERLYAAEARLEEAIEDLNAARIRFYRIVGKPLDHYRVPPALAGDLPGSVQDAIGTARQNSPLIKIALADLDAAQAMVTQATAGLLPRVAVELRGRHGEDLDGMLGRDQDMRAQLVARWNLYRGGIDKANRQEQIRRVDEQRYALHSAHRQVEEAVRLAWDRRAQQSRRLDRLERQRGSARQVLESYTEQFKVGERALLDLLDAQNSLINTEIAVATSRSALRFEEYRVAASMGVMLAILGIVPPEQAKSYARDHVGAPPTPDGETHKRRSPKY